MKTYDFFKYKELKKDRTKEEILDKQFSCGYINIEPFTYNSSFELLRDSLLDDSEIMEFEQPESKPNLRVVKRSISIWENMGIKLHDVDCLRYPRFNIIKKINPSKIPVRLGNRYDTGYYSYIESYFDKVNVINDGKALVYRIHLSRTTNDLSICGYNHEITHSQLFSDKGSCTDILDSETLPIFMELVFAEYIDKSGEALDTLCKIRLSDVADKLFDLSTIKRVDYIDRITSDIYIISTLQAIGLFRKYNYGNPNVKREMLSDVRKIFNGMSTVEDMLCKYDSVVGNVPKDIKFLKKSLIK